MRSLKQVGAVLMSLVLFYVSPAWSAERVVCSVTYTTGVAGVTSSPATGTCAWSPGGAVLVQCNTDVFASWAVNAAGTVITATSSDVTLAFATNLDPIPVCLQGRENHISVLGVTASGTCKFIPTSLRRCPR